MKTINCGVVGCGVIAPTHIESYRRIPDVHVKWLCDLDPAKADALGDRYSVPRRTADYADILSDPEVDVVSVCTDHFSHAEIAAAALDMGKHVVCEKCLTSTSDGLRRIMDARRRHPNSVFSGIFQHRFEPANRMLRQLISDGAFGRILNATLHVSCLRTDEYYQADAWRGTWSMEGGSVLINQSVHHLDLLRFFLGEPESVSAKYDNLTHQGVIETEDTIAVAMRFRSGALATMTATSGSRSVEWRSVYSITGTDGYVEYTDFTPSYLEFTDPRKKDEIERMFEKCGEDKDLLNGAAKDYYGGGHAAQIADVIDAVRSHRAPSVTGEDAAETARLVIACYDAARAGKWVTL